MLVRECSPAEATSVSRCEPERGFDLNDRATGIAEGTTKEYTTSAPANAYKRVAEALMTPMLQYDLCPALHNTCTRVATDDANVHAP